jgi:hypothetical protein
MDPLGIFLVTAAFLILVLLALLVLESLLKLRVAWKFRKVVYDACAYPDCLSWATKGTERNR